MASRTRNALQECPPVPYMPEKDPIQEMVSVLKCDQNLKTTIGEDTELRLLIWYCGMHEAFLMHMSTAVNRIKKRGTFKAYKEACEAYVEQRKVAKQVKAALAILNAAMSKGEKTSKKASEKASQKAQEGAALADAPDPELHTEYQADHEKAKFAAEATKNKCKAAATKMFQFYANLQFVDGKYAWNTIVKEQTEADLFKDLQGMSRKGPRGLLHKSFNDCIMFHLLTMFLNTRLSKTSTTFPTCSKSPRGLVYVSSYSA
jgi:hypothetical protein